MQLSMLLPHLALRRSPHCFALVVSWSWMACINGCAHSPARCIHSCPVFVALAHSNRAGYFALANDQVWVFWQGVRYLLPFCTYVCPGS
jgi:hypothetical protein